MQVFITGNPAVPAIWGCAGQPCTDLPSGPAKKREPVACLLVVSQLAGHKYIHRAEPQILAQGCAVGVGDEPADASVCLLEIAGALARSVAPSARFCFWAVLVSHHPFGLRCLFWCP